MERKVEISTGEITLVGSLHAPENLKPGEKRPAFITTHGFGGSRIDGSMAAVAPRLCSWGYPTLRYDSRGCGESGGERGRIIPMDQVEDLGKVIEWMRGQEGVDPDKIVILGDSLGAAVSLYTGGTNDAVAGVIAVGGWGNGAAKIKLQHAGPGQYDKYLDMLERNKKHKAETGESLKVSRYDIVPIPEHLRGGLPSDAIMEFPADTAPGHPRFSAHRRDRQPCAAALAVASRLARSRDADRGQYRGLWIREAAEGHDAAVGSRPLPLGRRQRSDLSDHRWLARDAFPVGRMITRRTPFSPEYRWARGLPIVLTCICLRPDAEAIYLVMRNRP